MKHYFCMHLWGCCGMKLAFESVHFSRVEVRPQSGWASFSPPRAWAERKVQEGRICPCFLSVCWLELGHRYSPALGLGFTQSTPLFLRPSGLNYDDTTRLPGSPACTWLESLGLSFHNRVSQFLIINLSLYFVYTSIKYIYIICTCIKYREIYIYII